MATDASVQNTAQPWLYTAVVETALSGVATNFFSPGTPGSNSARISGQVLNDRITYGEQIGYTDPGTSALKSAALLRRAYQEQEHFASQRVESVANRSALVSPVAAISKTEA